MSAFEFKNQQPPAFLQSGFRLFFLLALSGAVVLGLVWAAAYSFNLSLLRADYPLISWHAHEMLFAYAFAVITGFMLTSVGKQADIQPINRQLLLFLAILWLSGRILPFVLMVPLWYLALHEVMFMLLVSGCVAYAGRGKKTSNQGFIVSLFLLMAFANLLFYLGLMRSVGFGVQIGLYLGLYIYVALILVMGRRIIPSLIENAIGGGFQAKNDRWLDWISRGVFVLFLLAELVALSTTHPIAILGSAILGLILFVLHAVRLAGWHHRELWLHPLLWVLYIAYAWVAFGFLLKFLALAWQLNPWVAVHAFAYGGIGLITAGMMARVTMGYTGRNVFVPPAGLGIWFGILTVGVFVRVVMVGIWPDAYAIWILATQLLWVIGFTGLAWLFIPMLIRPGVVAQPPEPASELSGNQEAVPKVNT